MDYPLLNLLFGLALVAATTLSLGLAVLVARQRWSKWLVRASWAGAAVSLLLAASAGALFVRQMQPAANRQLALATLLIVGLAGWSTPRLARITLSRRAGWVLFGLQLLSSLLSAALAFGLYRSLVPTELLFGA